MVTELLLLRSVGVLTMVEVFSLSSTKPIWRESVQLARLCVVVESHLGKVDSGNAGVVCGASLVLMCTG